MAEIVLTRVDFRLIHGQVVAAWNKYVNATKIVIIDDVLAQDELMQTIYTSAAPPGVKVKIYDYAKAKRLWEKNRFGENGRVMVIFRNLQNCLKAFELGINLGKSRSAALLPHQERRLSTNRSIWVRKTSQQ